MASDKTVASSSPPKPAPKTTMRVSTGRAYRPKIRDTQGMEAAGIEPAEDFNP